MTTNLKKYPTRVHVNHNGKRGMIAIDQIRTVDKTRIVRIFENLTKSEIEKCKKVIKRNFCGLKKVLIPITEPSIVRR